MNGKLLRTGTRQELQLWSYLMWTYYSHSHILVIFEFVSWFIKMKGSIVAIKVPEKSNKHLTNLRIRTYSVSNVKNVFSEELLYLSKWRMHVKKECAVDVKISIFPKMCFIPTVILKCYLVINNRCQFLVIFNLMTLPNVIWLVQFIKSGSNRRYHQQGKYSPPNLIVAAIPWRYKIIKFIPSFQGYALPLSDEMYQDRPINHLSISWENHGNLTL